MLSIVTWLWHRPGYRTTFTGEHVNALARMCERHYPHPHRVICVTNDRSGIGADITVIPDDADFADVPSPHGGMNPSCYRRLRMFRPDIARWFGERFVSIDLDVVLVGDVTPLWDRQEDFVGWLDPIRKTQYCGSMILMSAGARPQVWEKFDPATSPRAALAARCTGSDQGWISHCIPGEATWTTADGVYSYRIDHLERGLPANARLTVWHGRPKPWDAQSLRTEWVRNNYRVEKMTIEAA